MAGAAATAEELLVDGATLTLAAWSSIRFCQMLTDGIGASDSKIGLDSISFSSS
jgi:hypothetical protein